MSLICQMQRIRNSSSFNGVYNYTYNGVQLLNFNCRHFQHLPFLLLFSTSSSISSTNQGTNNNPSSSIANFLVKSLGFSPNQSLFASSELSKRRDLTEKSKNRANYYIQKANSVVHFLKLHGFQEPDIKKLILRRPQLLFASVDKTLKPKIKLLSDLGLSKSSMNVIVTRNSGLLTDRVGVALDVLKSVLGCNENVISFLSRSYGVYMCQVVKNLVPNVELLRNDYGIGIEKIHKHVVLQPKPFLIRPDLFRSKLIKVEEKLGIPRESGMFLYGLHLANSLSDKSFEVKCEVFRSFGWTRSQLTSLITHQPMCLALSEGRIRENLEFLMNELDLKPDFLALHGSLFSYSVKKRLLPRHRVLQVLKEKGLLRKEYALASVAPITPGQFIKRFVLPFKEVHQVYAQLTGVAWEPCYYFTKSSFCMAKGSPSSV